MKKVLIYFMLVPAIAIISNCKGSKTEEPTATEKQLERLAGAYNTASSKVWTVESVTFGGSEDRTTDWSNFTLTIGTDGSGTNTYSTSGAFSPGPWPASGAWTFGGTTETPNINLVVRDGNLDVSVTVTDTSLTMTFTFNQNIHTGGRTEAVDGEYVFKMK